MIAVVLWVWSLVQWTTPHPGAAPLASYVFDISDIYGYRTLRAVYADSFTSAPRVTPGIPGSPAKGFMVITESGISAVRVATIDSAGRWSQWSNVAVRRVGHPGGASNMRDSLQACMGYSAHPPWQYPTHLVRGLLSASWMLSQGDSVPERFEIIDQETVQARCLDILCAEWRKGYFGAPCRRGVHDSTWCGPQ
jgi:hypothetical protein